MKKKPSLLDIELFVRKRTDERKKEMSQLESESEALVFESIASPPEASHLSEQVLQSGVSGKSGSDTNLIPSDAEEKRAEPSAAADLGRRGTAENEGAVDERFTGIIEVMDLQMDDINKLKQEVFKLKEQIRVYHSFLGNQQKKIAELEKMVSSISREDYEERGVVDADYLKLLLKNIIWLKEEKDFSSNDVARLFRAEGFQTPHPYGSWDEKVINNLYREAKKTFL